MQAVACREKLSGALLYTLRVEDAEHQEAEPKSYTTICPRFVWNPLRAPLHKMTVSANCSPSVLHKVSRLEFCRAGLQIWVFGCEISNLILQWAPLDLGLWLWRHASCRHGAEISYGQTVGMTQRVKQCSNVCMQATMWRCGGQTY